ncbi:MAG: ABC transporter substrate-binding protein [Candidatus Rifleibacteriota bacterium]
MKNSKVLGWLLLVVLLVGFASMVNAEGKKIGILWYEKSGMAKRVLAGFMEVFKAKAPDVELEIQINLKDEEEAKPIYEKFQASKDAILFLRSAGTTFMKKYPTKIPAFIGASNDPVILGVITDNNKPDNNITGVSYYIKADKKIEIFKKVFPEMKSVGLIVEGKHPSAAVDEAETKAACEAMGLAFEIAKTADKGEVLKSAKELAGKVNLIILGNQTLVSDNSKDVASVIGNIPMVSYMEKPVESGDAVCALAADDEKLGRMLAESVYEVVINGKKVEEVPVKFDSEPKFLLSEKAMKKWNVNVPEDLKKDAKMF